MFMWHYHFSELGKRYIYSEWAFSIISWKMFQSKRLQYLDFCIKIQSTKVNSEMSNSKLSRPVVILLGRSYSPIIRMRKMVILLKVSNVCNEQCSFSHSGFSILILYSKGIICLYAESIQKSTITQFCQPWLTEAQSSVRGFPALLLEIKYGTVIFFLAKFKWKYNNHSNPDPNLTNKLKYIYKKNWYQLWLNSYSSEKISINALTNVCHNYYIYK